MLTYTRDLPTKPGWTEFYEANKHRADPKGLPNLYNEWHALAFPRLYWFRQFDVTKYLLKTPFSVIVADNLISLVAEKPDLALLDNRFVSGFYPHKLYSVGCNDLWVPGPIEEPKEHV